MSHTQHLKVGTHTTQARDVCNRRLNLPNQSSKTLQNFNSVSIGLLVSISGCYSLSRSCALSCGAMLPPTEHSHSGSDAESDAACDADLDADSATWGWEDCHGYCVHGADWGAGRGVGVRGGMWDAPCLLHVFFCFQRGPASR